VSYFTVYNCILKLLFIDSNVVTNIFLTVDYQIITDPYTKTTIGNAIAPYYYSHIQPYEGCRKEKFRYDGKYTDLICDLVEKGFSEICGTRRNM
jgi:hypothetical protein